MWFPRFMSIAVNRALTKSDTGRVYCGSKLQDVVYAGDIKIGTQAAKWHQGCGSADKLGYSVKLLPLAQQAFFTVLQSRT